MKKEILKRVLLQTIPLLIGIILTYFFWHNNLLLTVLYIGIIAIVFKIEYNKNEIFVLIYGIIIGLLVEVIGTSISGYQSFTKPSFLGIPLWLPLVWGYGFVLMGRISKALTEK